MCEGWRDAGRTTGSHLWREQRGEAGARAGAAAAAPATGAATAWRRAPCFLSAAGGAVWGGAVRASGHHPPHETAAHVRHSALSQNTSPSPEQDSLRRHVMYNLQRTTQRATEESAAALHQNYFTCH